MWQLQPWGKTLAESNNVLIQRNTYTHPTDVNLNDRANKAMYIEPGLLSMQNARKVIIIDE